jgi:hypothetical protein
MNFGQRCRYLLHKADTVCTVDIAIGAAAGAAVVCAGGWLNAQCLHQYSAGTGRG